MAEYVAIDTAGHRYLTEVLGLSSAEIGNHCIEKCSVDSVDYYNNVLNISSIEDGNEYAEVRHICHTDYGYYSYGIAGDVWDSEDFFEASTRCFIYDNGSNYVFGLIRTDPNTGEKTCAYSFPCLQKTDRIGGDVYGNCNVDAMEKTLEVVAGRTYWPYMAIYVDVDGTKYCVTVLDLHHGEEAIVVNNDDDALVTFPCIATEIQRHLDLRVQTWPDEALVEDWIRVENVGCVSPYIDTDLDSTGPVYEHVVIGEYEWQNIMHYTDYYTYTCSASDEITMHTSGYYTDYLERDDIEHIRLDDDPLSGHPIIYYSDRDDDERTFHYYDWYHATPGGYITLMMQPQRFYDLVLDNYLDILHITDRSYIHTVVDDITHDYPSPYQDFEYIEDTDSHASLDISGIYTARTLEQYSTYSYYSDAYSYWDTPEDDFQYRTYDYKEAYWFPFPAGAQLREPRPVPIIYLFERWYGFLTTHVILNQTVSKREDYNFTTLEWDETYNNVSDFTYNDVIAQLYLAHKNDTDDDSTLMYHETDKIQDMSIVIEERTKQLIDLLGFESIAELTSAIDQESSDTGIDLYYAKYDLHSRLY